MIVCCFCNCSGSETSQVLSGVKLMWPGVMIASAAFQAGASIIKVKAIPICHEFYGIV